MTNIVISPVNDRNHSATGKQVSKVSNKDLKKEIKAQIGQSVKAYSKQSSTAFLNKLNAPVPAKSSRSMLQILEDNDPVIAQMAFNRSSASTLKTLDPPKSDTLGRQTAILFQISEEQQNRGQKKGVKRLATEPDEGVKIPMD